MYYYSKMRPSFYTEWRGGVWSRFDRMPFRWQRTPHHLAVIRGCVFSQYLKGE